MASAHLSRAHRAASKRVGVWRDLRRLGGLYLQQCVCIFPDLPAVTAQVNKVAAKIPALGGETFLLEVPKLDPEEEQRIVAAFRDQRMKEYAEIVEECETKFVKEIEFETFPRELHVRGSRRDRAGPGEDPPLVRPGPRTRLVQSAAPRRGRSLADALPDPAQRV